MPNLRVKRHIRRRNEIAYKLYCLDNMPFDVYNQEEYDELRWELKFHEACIMMYER